VITEPDLDGLINDGTLAELVESNGGALVLRELDGLEKLLILAKDGVVENGGRPKVEPLPRGGSVVLPWTDGMVRCDVESLGITEGALLGVIRAGGLVVVVGFVKLSTTPDESHAGENGQVL
jgi:hypothetical protein